MLHSLSNSFCWNLEADEVLKAVLDRAAHLEQASGITVFDD